MKNAQLSDKTIVSKRIVPQPPARRPQPDAMRLNTAQRQTVRVALATGATIAALIGAQTLALLDRSAIVKPITLSRPDPGNVPSTSGGSLNLSGTPDDTPVAGNAAPIADATSAPSLDLNGDSDIPTAVSRTASAHNKGPQPARVKPTVVPDNAQPFPLTISS